MYICHENATYMDLYKSVLRLCHLSRGNIFSVPSLVFFLGFFLLLRIPIACEYQPNDTEDVISQRQREEAHMPAQFSLYSGEGH